MQVTVLPNELGAIVSGLTPAEYLGHKEELQTLLWKYKVVSFDGLEGLTATELESIASIFGDIHPLPKLKPISPEHPNIHSIEREEQPTGYPLLFGGNWHSDQAYLKKRPIYTILYSLDVPAQGGETLFIDMTSILQKLPSAIVEQLQNMEVIQSVSRRSFEEAINSNGKESYLSYFFEPRMHTIEEKEQLANHPIVKIALDAEKEGIASRQSVIVKHPHTGVESLNISPSFTREFVGMSREESDRWFDLLWNWQLTYAPQLSLGWKRGQIVIWDNRSLVHKATPSVGKRRLWRIMATDPIDEVSH